MSPGRPARRGRCSSRRSRRPERRHPPVQARGPSRSRRRRRPASSQMPSALTWQRASRSGNGECSKPYRRAWPWIGSSRTPVTPGGRPSTSSTISSTTASMRSRHERRLPVVAHAERQDPGEAPGPRHTSVGPSCASRTGPAPMMLSASARVGRLGPRASDVGAGSGGPNSDAVRRRGDRRGTVRAPRPGRRR